MKTLYLIVGVSLLLVIMSTNVTADREALLNSLDAANVMYIASEVEERGMTMQVITEHTNPVDVCKILADHPDVSIKRVYDGITGEDLECK